MEKKHKIYKGESKQMTVNSVSKNKEQLGYQGIIVTVDLDWEQRFVDRLSTKVRSMVLTRCTYKWRQ